MFCKDVAFIVLKRDKKFAFSLFGCCSLVMPSLPIFFHASEKSGSKNDDNNKIENNGKTSSSEKSSRSTSPTQSTKSSSSPSTPQDDRGASFPPPKVTKDSVRGKCREMIVNSLNVEGDFDPCMYNVQFYYIDMTVLLGIIPLVKLIQNHIQDRMVYFPYPQYNSVGVQSCQTDID